MSGGALSLPAVSAGDTPVRRRFARLRLDDPAAIIMIAASAILTSPMVRANGPDTAEICGPMERSGSPGLKAAMRPTVGRKPCTPQA